MSTSTTAIIIRDDASLTASFTAAANELKQVALEKAALVGVVTTAEQQQWAVQVQQALVDILAIAEKARKAAKDAPLTYTRNIDQAAKSFVAELMDESSRVAKAIGDFQALELEKVRAAQAAENERLTALERERHAEAANAQSHEHLDAIHAKYDERTRVESVAYAPAREKGQIVKQDWSFQMRDEAAFLRWALATGNTGCFTIEPRVSEIKALLKAGMQIPGVKGWPTVNATVRAGQEPPKEITV